MCGDNPQDGFKEEYVLTQKVSRMSGTPQFSIEEHTAIAVATVYICKECYKKVTGEAFNFFNEAQSANLNQKRKMVLLQPLNAGGLNQTLMTANYSLMVR
jgi:hypothetical protein